MSNIILLGLVSLFTDISTEMIYPILPLYLSAVMGAGPAIIGIIEGIAESLASIVKLFSGILADRYGNKKRLAFAGYASSMINKVIILLSVSWAGVLVARIIDRFGKGIRTAPRDALIAESANRAQLGKAYGMHKGLDLLGTAIGILLAWLIISGAFDSAIQSITSSSSELSRYKTIFIVSLVPALIGLSFLAFVKEKNNDFSANRANQCPDNAPASVSYRRNAVPAGSWLKKMGINTRLKLFFIFIFLFTLGNSSNAFIILRAVDVGFSPVNVVLLYFVYNVTGSLLSYPAGILSDKIGRKKLLCAGYFLYGIVYLGIALVSNNTAFAALFIVYGFYTALTAGVERALIVEMVPVENKAGALGMHSAIVGIGLLPASVIAGFLWQQIGPSAPFLFGAVLAFITSAAVGVILRKPCEI